MAAKLEIEEESELITLEELAVMLHRNVNTLRVAVSQRPESLPPRVRFPGVQRNYWRRPTVRNWIASYEESFDVPEPAETVGRVQVQVKPAREKPEQQPKRNRVGRPTKAEQMRKKMALT
jgi:hypothetical protein